MNNNNNAQSFIRINNRIRAPQVRLIGSDGAQIGIVSTYEALKLAQEENLDLVEINPKASPPVARLMNYGKFCYEEKKKAAEAKKNQKAVELKEITLRPKTEEHDLNHKLASVKDFLADGNKVKLTIRFRGREAMHLDIGRKKLEYLIEQLNGLIQPSPPISYEGKLMSVIVMPLSNK